jgi:enterochelin esterase-like enzyme
MSRRWLLGVPIVVLAAVIALAATVTALDGAPRAGITDVTIRSALLGRDMSAQVFIPRGHTGDQLPSLYLFHGRYGSERGWFGGSFGRPGIGIDGIAQQLIDEGRIRPIAIVSASIDDSYGVDSPPSAEGYDHGPYERYILDELIPHVQTRYTLSAEPADRAMGGLSMGGFAALHAAFRHPERFRGVAGLSPAVFEGTLPDRQWLYPTPAARRDHDPLLLARTADVTGMRVFLGYGRRDYAWIQDATDVLAERLAARGIDAGPRVVAGGHDVPAWQRLAPAMLETLFGTTTA